jgi:hypothetical protein
MAYRTYRTYRKCQTAVQGCLVGFSRAVLSDDLSTEAFAKVEALA